MTITVYHKPDSNIWGKALVIGTAEKATSQNKYWFNIKNMDRGNLLSIDFSKITDWKLLNEEITFK